MPDYTIRLAQRISSVTPEQIRAINVIIDSGPEKSKALLTLLDAKEEPAQPEQTAAPVSPPDRRTVEERRRSVHEVDFERRGEYRDRRNWPRQG